MPSPRTSSIAWTLRQALFWVHLAVGACVAAIVIIMSATGVLLTYQKQLTLWADTRGLRAAPPAGVTHALPADSLLARVRAVVPGTPTAITWRAGLDAPVQVAFGRERTVFANPYTGQVLGEGSKATRDFFAWVTGWHRWLARTGDARDTGRAITGAANVGFLFLVLSGFVLWWPRRWTPAAFRQVAWFRRGLSPKARDFNWHHVIGLWSVVPLVIVVASGVVISYPWASGLVYRAMGERVPAPQGEAPRAAAPAGSRAAATPEPGAVATPALPPQVDLMLARATERVPAWRSITLQIPRAGATQVPFAIDAGSGGQPQARATLTFDRESGRVVKWEPFATQSPARRARSILRFAHTGEVLGVVGQTLAGLVSLGAIVLAYTGIALTVRRFVAWRKWG